jgi:hypothetical protein
MYLIIINSYCLAYGKNIVDKFLIKKEEWLVNNNKLYNKIKKSVDDLNMEFNYWDETGGDNDIFIKYKFDKNKFNSIVNANQESYHLGGDEDSCIIDLFNIDVLEIL